MKIDVEIPVKQLKKTARKKIIERSIERDQAAILKRWADTLIHVGGSDAAHKAHLRAVKIMTVAMAAVACGEFEVSTSGENSSFGRPSNAFCVADYLSHASRVMIDLSDLSEHHRKEFLRQFPKKELDKRSSTHHTARDEEGRLTEFKDSGHGVTGAFKVIVDALGDMTGIGPLAAKYGIKGSDVTDYGVDILMGGVGKANLSGGLSNLGRDGHVLIYLDDTNSVMIGLEQTKPIIKKDVENFLSIPAAVVSAGYNFFSGNGSPSSETGSPVRIPTPPKLEPDDDNTCGLSGDHSMQGHSDNYTAAGSLYFSNLIYKIKLMEQKGALTPAKYNGMRVHLNDKNYGKFVRYYKALSSARNTHDVDAIKKLLWVLPRTASRDLSVEDQRNNYLFLVKYVTSGEIKSFFKQLKDVYFDGQFDQDQKLFEQKLEDIKAWLAEPRRLPQNDRILSTFDERDIRSVNPLVKTLERTLNKTVEILKKNATDELMQQQIEPSRVIKQMVLLEEFYRGIELDQQPPFYRSLKSLQDKYGTLCYKIKQASSLKDGSGDAAFPFGYLIQLQELENKIAEAMNTNESRNVINLMVEKVELRKSNDDLKRNLGEDRSILKANEDLSQQLRTERAKIEEMNAAARLAVGEKKVLSQELQEVHTEINKMVLATKLSAHELQHPSQEDLKNDIPALEEAQQQTPLVEQEVVHRNASEEEDIIGQVYSTPLVEEKVVHSNASEKEDINEREYSTPLVEEEVVHSHASEEEDINEPVYSTPQHEEAISNWAFVWECMSSSAVLNIYGAVLMVAGLIIAGVVAAGAIPVGLGATVVASGFALSAACFFNARSNRPETPAATQTGLAQPIARQ